MKLGPSVCTLRRISAFTLSRQKYFASLLPGCPGNYEALWHVHHKVSLGMSSPSTNIIYPSSSDFQPFGSRKNQYERRRLMIRTQGYSRATPVTAAADGDSFLRCNCGNLLPHDGYTHAQRKVNSQLGIILQNSQLTTLLRHSSAVHFTLKHASNT